MTLTIDEIEAELTRLETEDMTPSTKIRMGVALKSSIKHLHETAAGEERNRIVSAARRLFLAAFSQPLPKPETCPHCGQVKS